MDKALRGVVRSASGIAGSLVLAVAASKWVATMGGSSGVGVFGQLKNLQQTFLGVGTLNGQAAFIQGMASRRPRERWAFAAVAVRSMLAVAVLLYVVGLLATPWLSARLLGMDDRAFLLAIVLTLTGSVLYVVATVATFVLAAVGRLGLVARIQVAGSAGVLAGIMIAVRQDSNLAAAGFAIFMGGVSSCIVAVHALGRVRLARLIAASVQRRHATYRPAQTLRAFGAMSAGMALGGMIGAGTRLILRAIILRREGLAATGLFEAAWTISMTYMGLLLSSLGGYLLPALSAERDAAGRSRLLSEFLRVAVACGVPLICFLMLFRHEIIRLLYSSALAPAATMLGIMVAGDFFKLLGWVFAMPMLAAADARAFLLYEACWNAAFLGGILALAGWGWPILTAAGVSFAVCYVLYAVATYVYCRGARGLVLSAAAIRTMVGGVIVTSLVVTFGSTADSALLRGLLLAIAMGYSALGLGSAGRHAVRNLVRREA